ncbi:alanine/glycine:cation symporter family protein [Paramicrobacterium agarici]|uniref:alanine/glycine:cation symporter family protein n=1 Tax=Paramicrobacterium agarici TaxID=630514 RepID=UPI001150FEAF|nr:alanine/glycine:cation symporter family protein [Microbacterium agarici]TQO23017.1 AGCS family alanine or glycine:cation symporter [Microbacterium agarici]
MDVISAINDLIWNPMAYLALGLGLFFTVLTRGIQFRRIPDMIRELGAKKDTPDGNSPLQAVLLTLASRVGVGNIAGVATAIYAGGPGAMFWMVLCALLGSASAYAESTLAQVFKTKIDGEHRGGVPYYVEKGLKAKWLAVILAAMILIGYGFVFPGVQSNNIAQSVNEAFSIPLWASALFVTALLAFVIIGGTKRIVAVAQVFVPFMAAGYIIATIIMLAMNAEQIWPTMQLVFSSAFGVNQVFGGILGAAVAWGVRRAVFSNVAGIGEGTFGAASAAVRHPAKQGLVQAFSIFIDTVVVCNATGIMILISGLYDVADENGTLIFSGANGIEAGPAYTQAAIDTIAPGIGPGFVAIALFFFAFTTLIAFYYIAKTNLVYLFRGRAVTIADWVLKAGMIAITFYGSVESPTLIWAIGDIGYGSIGWVNMICILLLSPVVFKVTRDYDRQRRAGTDLSFNPESLGIKRAHFWMENHTGTIARAESEGLLDDEPR